MRKIGLTLLLALLLCGSALAECPRFSVEEYPNVDGSTAMLPLSYALMMESTGISEEEAKVAITHHRTTDSFYALIDGRADLLIVGNPAEAVFDYALEKGVQLLMKPIGVDALVFLVSDLNPVSDVTHDQITGVYAGEFTNWRELGGEDLPIIAYQRNAEAGSQVMMENVVMAERPMTDAPKQYRADAMEGLVDEIASYRNSADAIGYSVYYYVTNMYIQQGIKLLSVDGVAPSNQTISKGEYPYTQYNYAVIRADAPEGSPERKLFEYLGTEEGKAFMTEHEYVPVAGVSQAIEP